MSDRPAGPPAIDDLRTFVAAKDFAVSQAFYEALGWSTVWTDGSMALMEFDDHRFLLQDFYVREWAENSMLSVAVPDAAAWAEWATAVLAAGDFGDARVDGPNVQDWGATITHVWDPSGVLLHFTEFDG